MSVYIYNDEDAANGFCGFDFSQIILSPIFGMILTTKQIMESWRNCTHRSIMLQPHTVSVQPITKYTWAPFDKPTHINL